MRFNRFLIMSLILVFIVASLAYTQDRADYDMVSRIWEEEINRSQVMEILSYMSDVIGPRIPGSPAIRKACEWTSNKFKKWELKNVALEPWGEFGRGWSNEYISVHLVSPSYQPIIAYPIPWTSSTKGKIRGEPIYVDIDSKEDLEKHRGNLKGAIVLTQKSRQAPPTFTASAIRMTQEDLDELSRTPIPVKPRKKGKPPAKISWEELEDFFRSEEVGLLIEPSDSSRRDYGTVKVDAYEGEGKNHLKPNQNPRIVMAAEHYGRIFRIMDHKIPLVLEAEVVNKFYDDDLQGYNVVAEIPGTDKKDELVMLGAHIDSWAGGTGAVDNAAGCAVVMEVMRILKELGVKPRRTIRAALWDAEEHGYFGSRGYIVKHFGDTDQETLSRGDWEELEKYWRNPLGDSKTLIAKPDYDKLSAYYNYDNGTGKILGIYLQENYSVRPVFEEWIKPLRDLGVGTLTMRNTHETDHNPFDWIGLPGFQFIQDEIDYMTRTHHTNQDVFDHCLPEDLIQSAIVLACFVYHTAMREEMLPRKPMPLPRTQK
jgi:carboxypeptidase Q